MRIDARPLAERVRDRGRGDFERLVRSLSRPAERDALPPPAGAPSAEQAAALAAACLAHGIELVGPPLAVLDVAA